MITLYDLKFREYVESKIKVPDEQKEPFCPFAPPCYCDLAFSDICYIGKHFRKKPTREKCDNKKCGYAAYAYEKEKEKEQENGND